MNKRGFTLIELLVVIAIIGILSTIALAFLGGARDRGRDAAVKQQLNSMKTEIELAYGTTGLYGGASCGVSGGPASCDTICASAGKLFDPLSANPKISQLLYSSIISAGGVPPGPGGVPAANSNQDRCKVNTATTEWAAAIKLPSDSRSVGDPTGNNWWCVDSKNTSKQLDNTSTPINTADATTAYCN